MSNNRGKANEKDITSVKIKQEFLSTIKEKACIFQNVTPDPKKQHRSKTDKAFHQPKDARMMDIDTPPQEKEKKTQ